MLRRTISCTFALVGCVALGACGGAGGRTAPVQTGESSPSAVTDAPPQPDPACTTGSEPAVLVSDVYTPGDLVLDGQHVFFSTNPDTTKRKPGRLVRIPKQGGHATDLATNESVPRELGLDGAELYWLSAGGEIKVTPSSGGTTRSLVVNRTVGELAVDKSGVYGIEARVISRIPKHTGEVVDLVAAPEDRRDASNRLPGLMVFRPPTDPRELTLDDKFVFWVDHGEQRRGIYAIPKRGGEIVPIAEGAEARFLVATRDALFWPDNNGSIWKSPKRPTDGDHWDEIAHGLKVVTSIAIDEKHLYFTEVETIDGRGNGRVLRVPLSGGPPEELVRGLRNPGWIALDSVAIYWANVDGAAVMRRCK